MLDIDEIRRINMRTLEAEAGTATEAGARCEMSLAQWANLRDGVKDSRTGKRRGMRKETAIKIAKAFDRPIGWLDIDHSAQQKPLQVQQETKIYPVLSDVVGEAVVIMQSLPRSAQLEALGAIKIIAAQHAQNSTKRVGQ